MAEHHTLHDAADHDAEAYQHGSMSIEEQRMTWGMFQVMAKWGSLIIACVLLFLTIWFQPGGSFVGGFLAAAVVAAAGLFFLKAPKKTGH